jgi:hypothetical protein
MKALLIAALVMFFGVAQAQVHVSGYTRKDGTYVQPHMRSAPNRTKLDNYSTIGNTNPYTGKPGTVDPYKPQPYRVQTYAPQTYAAPRTLYQPQPIQPLGVQRQSSYGSAYGDEDSDDDGQAGQQPQSIYGDDY